MYDVIVIGAGHAGCEAALACARLKLKTLALTINMDKIALMPCNPAIGGVGKTQLVREVDAMGGQIAKSADKTSIQFKILNKKKGPAVQALRAQIDKKEYEIEMKKVLENTRFLTLKEGTVSKLLVKGNKVSGVQTESGLVFRSRVVVVTSGTFLRGRIIIGGKDYPAGRMGEYPAMQLTKSLNDLGFEVDRFQTATPPRIDRRTINFTKTSINEADCNGRHFSFWSKWIDISRDSIPSYLTYTNSKTHDIIAKNIKSSPIRSGMVETHGPRHCPSIDRKVINFPNKKKHPIFIEPEGKFTNEMYLQGLTTSMPFDIQQKIVNSVEGLEGAKIIRPGYAVEYDYIIPSQLNYTLESKLIENLYFAGQINGTSGYEEAAAQGFLAGVNAALKILKKEPLVLTRDTSYIGVLIDDLVTKDLMEPYRMYTSRAEYRLILRPDNADLRLAAYSKRIGLLSQSQYQSIIRKNKKIDFLLNELKKEMVKPEKDALLETDLRKTVSAYKLLKRPEVSIYSLKEFIDLLDNGFDRDILRQVEIMVKYEGYINRQLSEIKKLKGLENYELPNDINYFDIKGLTYEAQEILTSKKPNTLGQASRIAGISPVDISILMLNLRK
ncbi:MAG: tRNA uridine-5-carboxymethylaminomethyl(34) synthesis enzyme MnmG [Actinomycetota bacterium]